MREFCSRIWSAIVGQATSYACSAHQNLKWIWTFNDGELPPNAEPQHNSQNSTFSILDIQEIHGENSGIYRCLGYEGDKLVVTEMCYLRIDGKLDVTLISFDCSH